MTKSQVDLSIFDQDHLPRRVEWVLDRCHTYIDQNPDKLVSDVITERYAHPGGDYYWSSIAQRVARHLYPASVHMSGVTSSIIKNRIFCPAGRVLSAAGTGKKATMMNCYVNGTLGDSMEGIYKGLMNAGTTLQHSGGIGTDFTPLRPKNAYVGGVGKTSSAGGPVKFMGVWDALSKVLRTSGERRGAMMATIRCDHPDVMDFITAKSQKGVLEQFNVSVLITDEFMKAVADGDMWELMHKAEPNRTLVPNAYYRGDRGMWVYQCVQARDIWHAIMQHTYHYAEPGVIFIDRINQLNNLKNHETINCTNPCGEQPLPPHGACDLGAVNLSRMVKNAFKADAQIDWPMLQHAVHAGVFILNRVMDVTPYPLAEQREEQLRKRRIGLGITGLADMLYQLNTEYNTEHARRLASKVMSFIADTAYATSASLSKMSGDTVIDGGEAAELPFVKTLSKPVQAMVAQHGLYNGVLLTVAPVGTTSIALGNVSSGLEPTFAHTYERTVFSGDTTTSYTTSSYSKRLRDFAIEFQKGMAPPPLPLTATKISPEDHVAMQAAIQQHVDASVSKTINCPADYPFEKFVNIYDMAWNTGCKGCTTYKPSEVRGAVMTETETEAETEPAESAEPAELIAPGESAEQGDVVYSGDNLRDSASSAGTEEVVPFKRPVMMQGYTYKIKWHSWPHALYMTINHDQQGVPRELFFQSKDTTHQDWMQSLALMISAVFRRGGDIDFLAEELMSVTSAHDGAMKNQRYHPSIIAYIGEVLRDHLSAVESNLPPSAALEAMVSMGLDEGLQDKYPEGTSMCPQCRAKAVIVSGGCPTCMACGWSKC